MSKIEEIEMVLRPAIVILVVIMSTNGTGCSMEPPLEGYSVLHDVESAPNQPRLPDAVTLDEPLDNVALVPYLEGFEASPETSALPEAVTLEELECSRFDPIEQIDLGPDLFMRTTSTRALFESEEPVRLSLGIDVAASWATCRESGERCLYESFQTESRQDEERSHLFVTTFSRCTGCNLECELEASSAWAGEFRFESEALPQGVYQVMIESRKPTVMGFVVDDEAAKIVTEWSDTCRSLSTCRPLQIALTTPSSEITVDADETVEVRLQLEVPFRCPADGVVTDVGWDLSGDRISPVFYAVEPGHSSCISDRSSPLVVERTLRIDAGFLAPGTYTIEHDGEVVTTIHVR